VKPLPDDVATHFDTLRDVATAPSMIDLDTPYHDDHVRDNVLNAGCHRCSRLIGADNNTDWQEHRVRLGYEKEPPDDAESWKP
jgi:hypothetical protein